MPEVTRRDQRSRLARREIPLSFLSATRGECQATGLAEGNTQVEVPLAKQSLFKSFTRFFFWQSKRKRKSLAKRKARIGDFAACARRPTLRALDLRHLLKKVDENSQQTCRETHRQIKI